MSEILSKIFGSPVRVKIFRLFLLNPEEVLTPKEISRRSKVSPNATKKELSMLSGIDFICKRKKSIEQEKMKGRVKIKKTEGWALNPAFSLLSPLKRFILSTAPLAMEDLLKRITRVGKIKLIIISGIFIDENDSRADLLIVGDEIKKAVLERYLREIESEIGKELKYAVFPTQDFVYRLGIYDKFIRDILDYPHEKLLDKLGI